MKGQQLPLSVQLRETTSFENFFFGPNTETRSALSNLAAGHGAFLYGAPASGKTHLLQALARQTHARGRHCAYLSLASLAEQGPAALEGFEALPVLCLDDIDAVSNKPDWSLALLRLLDQLRARNASIALAAIAPPDRLTIALPDLRTRFSALAVHGLKPLSDEDRSSLLQQRALGRGLELGEDVARWLLTQLARDTATLLAALDTLDRASLSAKRRLTLPFVQQTLRAHAAPDARTEPD